MRAVAVAGLVLAAGCAAPAVDTAPAVQAAQIRLYAEAVTGRFISLADFEDSPLTKESGKGQVRHFSIAPAGEGGPQTSQTAFGDPGTLLRHVVDCTRTGAGALEAVLPANAQLVYHIPKPHIFSQYTLLALAVHSDRPLEGLRIAIVSSPATWESGPMLLRQGWNDLLIDLHRLKEMEDFDIRRVSSIRLSFTSQAGQAEPEPPQGLRLNVDDIMLIDNRRELGPVPEGMKLVRSGLDYELQLPGRADPVRISQSQNGLWRLGADQPVIVLAAQKPDEPFMTDNDALPRPPREDLSALGENRMGEVELLEHNALRVRLRVSWYFPRGRALSEFRSAPQIHWQYTFYCDGRCVTQLTANLAAAGDLAGAWVAMGSPVRWSDGVKTQRWQFRPLGGSAVRLSCLAAPPKDRQLLEEQFIQPAHLEVLVGSQEGGEEDMNADGFNEGQGCYGLKARAGQCRFVLRPNNGAEGDAFVRIAGPWSAGIWANSDGSAIRPLVRLPDGSVLLCLVGPIYSSRHVEISGPVGLLEDK